MNALFLIKSISHLSPNDFWNPILPQIRIRPAEMAATEEAVLG